MKIAASLLLIILVTTTLGRQANNAQVKEPVSAEGLIRLVVKRIPVSDIIRTIKGRGVSFQSLQPIEDEIREAGEYLSGEEIDKLLSATRDNFRPPANQPFRVTYMSLKGVAVNLFLDRRIDKHWDQILGTRQYSIARNNVYKSLMQLTAKFSSAHYGQEYFTNEPETSDDLYDSRKLARFYRIRKKPLFVGSLGEPSGDGERVFPTTDYVSALARSLNDVNKQWRVIEVEADEGGGKKSDPPRDLYTFRKYVEPGELTLFRPAKIAAFYSHITKNYLPPDFAFIEFSVERMYVEVEPGEGCDDGEVKPGKLETSAALSGPLLTLNVAVIENISDKPVSTGRLFIRSNNSETLRTREQNQLSLNSAPAQELQLFTSGVLKPGEKVVIPIDLSVMMNDWQENWDSPAESADDPEEFAAELSRLRKSDGFTFPSVSRQVRITADTIERMLRSSKIDFSAGPEYLYGPSIRIDGVEINSYGYLVRDYERKNLNVTTTGILSGGSCPYVYTFSDGRWSNEGVILYGYNSKLKESLSEKLLQRFDGRVMIKERDPESSFIDLVQVRAISAEGTEVVLQPKNARLRVADGQYVKLEQDEQLIVEFETPPTLRANSFVLIASGYYIPYKLADRPLERNRRASVKYVIPRRLKGPETTSN